MDARFEMSNFEALERTYENAADNFEMIAYTRFQKDLPAAIEASRLAMERITLEEHPGHTQELADSTEVNSEDIAPSGAKWVIDQPADSHPNVDGSGGGQHFVQWLLPPGRGEITAPSDGPYATGKKALAGPFFGPVKHVKAYPGDPYPLKANPDIKSALDLFSSRWTTNVLQEMFA